MDVKFVLLVIQKIIIQWGDNFLTQALFIYWEILSRFLSFFGMVESKVIRNQAIIWIYVDQDPAFRTESLVGHNGLNIHDIKAALIILLGTVTFPQAANSIVTLNMQI